MLASKRSNRRPIQVHIFECHGAPITSMEKWCYTIRVTQEGNSPLIHHHTYIPYAYVTMCVEVVRCNGLCESKAG